jgi:organic radical activating enzyme
MKCKLVRQGLVINTNGMLAPCCMFKPTPSWKNATEFNINSISSIETYKNSQQLKNIEQTLDNDEFPIECQSCKEFESNPATAGASWRNIKSNMADSEFLLELRFSNLCNYSCYTCHPDSSSKIAANYSKLGMKYIPIENHWEKMSLNKIIPLIESASDISLLGGEPLYNKIAQGLLPTLTGKKSVSITTNGSLFPKDIDSVDNLLLSFSVDGIGKTNEYIRTGSDWDTVLRNINKSIQSNIRTHVTTTISIYNILFLDEIISEFNSMDIDFHYLNIVWNPKHQSIVNLHPELTSRAVECLSKCLKIIKHEQNKEVLLTLLKNVSKAYSPDLWKEFLDYTKTMDNLNGVYFSDILSEYGIELPN